MFHAAGHARTQLTGCPALLTAADTASPLPRQDTFPSEAGLEKLTTLFLGLVRAIPTVVLSVTLPACWDAAAGVLAAKLVDPAGHLGCRKEGPVVTRGYFQECAVRGE